VNWFRFKACVKCRGDLVLDEQDWLCLQCGTYYYTGLYQGSTPANIQPADIQPVERILNPEEKTGTDQVSLENRSTQGRLNHMMAILPQGSLIAATMSQI